MQQLAGINIWDETEYDRAFHLRIKVQSETLHPKEIVSILSPIAESAEAYLERFIQKLDSFISYVELLQVNFKRQHGFFPSKAKTCAEAMLNIIVMPYQTAALSFFQEGDVKLFMAYFDYLTGIMEITAGVLGAVSEKEGGGEKAGDYGVIHSLKEVKVLPNGVTEEWYQKILSEYLYHRRFLEEDPTGFSLVDQIVEDTLKEAEDPQHKTEDRHHRLLDHQNTILILAGVLMGKKIYEKLYTVWNEKESNKDYSQTQNQTAE